jgi:hypothetical protein
MAQVLFKGEFDPSLAGALLPQGEVISLFPLQLDCNCGY